MEFLILEIRKNWDSVNWLTCSRNPKSSSSRQNVNLSFPATCQELFPLPYRDGAVRAETSLPQSLKSCGSRWAPFHFREVLSTCWFLLMIIRYILDLAFASGRTTGYWGRYMGLRFFRNPPWLFEPLSHFPSSCPCHLFKVQFSFSTLFLIHIFTSQPSPNPRGNSARTWFFFSSLMNSLFSLLQFNLRFWPHCLWELLLSLSDLIGHGDQTHAWYITQMPQ